MNWGTTTILLGLSALVWSFPWTGLVIVPAAIWLWCKS
jgi:hypothetical protein